MTIGERIHSRRKDLRLTMKDIFDQEGIQTGNLSELEHDKYLPSVQTLISLSHILDCSVDWILTGNEHHSLNSETLKTKKPLVCDEVPLNESEIDLVAMCRYLNEGDRKTIFDLAKLKYEQATGEKESFYSTYFGEDKPPNDDPEDCETAHFGIA